MSSSYIAVVGWSHLNLFIQIHYHTLIQIKISICRKWIYPVWYTNADRDLNICVRPHVCVHVWPSVPCLVACCVIHMVLIKERRMFVFSISDSLAIIKISIKNCLQPRFNKHTHTHEFHVVVLSLHVFLSHACSCNHAYRFTCLSTWEHNISFVLASQAHLNYLKLQTLNCFSLFDFSTISIFRVTNMIYFILWIIFTFKHV